MSVFSCDCFVLHCVFRLVCCLLVCLFVLLFAVYIYFYCVCAFVTLLINDKLLRSTYLQREHAYMHYWPTCRQDAQRKPRDAEMQKSEGTEHKGRYTLSVITGRVHGRRSTLPVNTAREHG